MNLPTACPVPATGLSGHNSSSDPPHTLPAPLIAPGPSSPTTITLLAHNSSPFNHRALSALQESCREAAQTCKWQRHCNHLQGAHENGRVPPHPEDGRMHTAGAVTPRARHTSADKHRQPSCMSTAHHVQAPMPHRQGKKKQDNSRVVAGESMSGKAVVST